MLTLQVRPAAYQACAQVLQTCQFNLQLAFMAARTLGKYFQNQKGSVIDRQVDVTLKIALLARTQ